MFDADSLAELRRAAEQAAAAGADTFRIPQAAPVAERLAMLAEGALRADAERWLVAGASYHALVRLAARIVRELSQDAPGDSIYVPKAGGELEPVLALWPAVLALPTTLTLTPLDLVALRAFPVHPLGIVRDASWADGRLCSPAEYFFHDLDHARFKIREDLFVDGIEIPDAYQEGSTWEAQSGRHRNILGAATGKIGAKLWRRVEPRRALARRLVTFGASLGEPRAAAAELLLFEMLCEKSHALEPSVLQRELASGAHVEKIRCKHASGFYGDHVPQPATLAALDEVRLLLRETL